MVREFPVVEKYISEALNCGDTTDGLARFKKNLSPESSVQFWVTVKLNDIYTSLSSFHTLADMNRMVLITPKITWLLKLLKGCLAENYYIITGLTQGSAAI